MSGLPRASTCSLPTSKKSPAECAAERGAPSRGGFFRCGNSSVCVCPRQHSTPAAAMLRLCCLLRMHHRWLVPVIVMGLAARMCLWPVSLRMLQVQVKTPLVLPGFRCVGAGVCHGSAPLLLALLLAGWVAWVAHAQVWLRARWLQSTHLRPHAFAMDMPKHMMDSTPDSCCFWGQLALGSSG